MRASFVMELELQPVFRKVIKIEPRIITRAEHNVSRSRIQQTALRVLYRLKEAGYQAYLVGGGVRDMLLGREPKDFDVVTDARPEEIKAQFQSCRLIGRRFRLAHVRYGRDIIEVATFRALPSEEEGAEINGDVSHTEDGRILRDNIYGTIEEDAWRRDFTVNALYYNVADFSLVDYTGGMEDLRAGVMRVIGDPATRYREDPVRMLRAVRFAAKLGFRVHPDSEAPLGAMGPLLKDISSARLYEEVLKLFLSGCALQTFEYLRRYDLFRYLFPDTDACLGTEEHHFPRQFVIRALANTDARITEGKTVTPAFLFAALLWEPMRRQAALFVEQGMPDFEAQLEAARVVLTRQIACVSIPKRFSIPMREIWALQPRLFNNQGRRAARLVEHPRFRAAYDFLALRAQAGEDIEALVQWWTQIQELPATEREQVTGSQVEKKTKRRRRSRRRGAASGTASDIDSA